MTEILEFNSKRLIDVKNNLDSFIKKNQNNFFFNASKWEDNIWDITDFLSHKTINHKSKKVYFRSVLDSSSSKTTLEKPLAEPLLDFAKAAFCEIMRIKKLTEFKKIIYAIQALEFALLEQEKPACITEINFDTLEIAERYIIEKYKDAWNIAKRLENLVNNFIVLKELNPSLVQWNTSIKYQAPIRSDRIKPTNLNIDNHKSKLPHFEELVALANIHHTSTHIPDKIVTCFVVLSLFAPSRASEILSLPVNCIVQNNYQFSHEVSKIPPIGLKWNPLKGGQQLVKYAVNEEFGRLTVDVINYLIEIGGPAREAAEWYCNNPNKLYLPKNLEHLRDKPITLWEVCQILGKPNPIKGCHAYRYGLSKPLANTNDKSRMHDIKAHWVSTYDFKEFEIYVLSLLPKTFPILDGRNQQKWHESLFVLPLHILTPDIDTLSYIPSAINIDQINKQLGSNPGKITVFSRNGKKFDSGKEMRITTHQFRHLLNTLAQSKSLSQELIAFWSGRKSVKQNDVYNHIPQESIIDAYKYLQDQVQTIPQHGDLEDKVSKISKMNSISYDDALKLELGSIHITRYGICRHDYSLTPCPKDKDCGNCGEFSVMKGSEKQLLEARNQVALLSQAVVKAESYLADGHFGAEKWIEVNKPKLERWNKILAFLEDDTIPYGSMYTLRDPDSHQTKVGLAFEVRNAEPSLSSEENLILDLLKS
ncbi:hypothetical protein [Acinetobacter radioresistens]|uniref:hypothetical protein n=1 Tax=Acinetobacter radioresistens TaxID=40216 RepID=UPI002245B9E5|nr:hypothetical protein [Acinetobacter radioresistens]MCX0339447.1 hypothetical protein [Acinetobacter radioresistens]